MKVPFEWYCTQIKLKIELSLNQIEFKLNWRKLRRKLVHNVLEICSHKSIIYNYHARKKKHLSIPFKANSKPKSILVGIWDD